MPSLWTDTDTGGHPWLVAPPHPGTARPPAPPPGHAAHDDPQPAGRFARRAVIAAACVAAVVAGALVELLR